ncbi:bifunctional phosphoribosyl-AMP cyclohydrolase/phosphoribosyl-ATP diphosphatase HisIE [Breznakiellaceae bacterium SP9]
MVIASIDIQNGRVVQLKQGSQLVLERDNADALIEDFNRYGEVAIIDLDAAMGKGANTAMIKTLLRKAECRVGGGIRSPEQARELVSLGALKIIVGSMAFKDPLKKGAGIAGGEFAVNVPFLEALAKKIGRERVIVAVDARNNEITVDGWKTPTGLPLLDAARAVEPYASELLFTGVEREGTMSGIDLGPVKQLRAAVTCKITAAGGVSTIEEIEALSALNCDVQLGMALYTGKIKLDEAFAASLNWKKCGGLIPLIVQALDSQVLMTGVADKEAVSETFKRGNVCFHSRTRSKFWMKGESSGNTLKLITLRADCDRDALLAAAEPVGPTCHTGAWSCFNTDRRYTWELLQSIVAERLRNPKPGSYTAALDDELVREKVQEEAEELCLAKKHEDIVWEAADLLYFMTVLMARAGVSVKEVLDELDKRHKK